MKTTELIAQHIIEVFEGDNWAEVNMKDTLQDINYKEATTVTKASCNTIAGLVHHLSFYNEIVLKRLQGIDPLITETNGFDFPAIRNQDDWVRLKERCFESTRELAREIKNFPEEKLFEITAPGYSTYYKTLHGVSEHVHYHLGQIVLLKKLAKQQAQQFILSNSL